MTPTVKDEILAKGIPALTRAAGKEFSLRVDIDGFGNVNLNDAAMKPNGTTHDNNAWFHNDMKKLPYFQNYKLYDALAN